MDIQAASNFERYLYYLMDNEASKTKDLMLDFAKTGKIDLSNYKDQISRDFAALAVSEEEVIEVIKKFDEEFDYILDPHTAVGVKAAQVHQRSGIPVVCLSTAHPSKFGDAVIEAIGKPPSTPEQLVGILTRESRCELMESDAQQIKEFVKKNAIAA